MPTTVLTPVLLALVAAACFGVGTAMQARAAATGEEASGARSLLGLLRRPLWLTGTALDWAGALVHLVALRHGTLALVQPIAMSGVVCAVVAEGALLRVRPTRGQLLAAAQTAAGLGLLVALVGRTSPGSPTGLVLPASAAGVALVGGLVLLARGRSHRLQALLLGAAAGAAYGLSDALARTAQLAEAADPARLVWLVPAGGVLLVGGAGIVLSQAAFQRGRLAWSMPSQDSIALVVSLVLGAVFLEELPHVGASGLAGAVLALGLVGHGITRLARTAPTPVSRSEDLGQRGERVPAGVLGLPAEPVLGPPGVHHD